MPYYNFTSNDIFHNVMETHPNVEFLIHNRKIYYNGELPEEATQTEGGNVKHVPSGFLSLYEVNVDRREEDLIYPFITKDGTAMSFSTVSTTQFQSFAYGDVMSGSYPLATTISIERYVSPDGDFYDVCGKERPRMTALKNTLNHYKPISPYYAFSSDSHDMMTDDLTLVSVPSIFYGSSIEKGSVKLDYYIHGALVARIEDTNKNGELVQTVGEQGLGSVAGVVLYNEGFIILTGDWSLNDELEERYKYCPEPSDDDPEHEQLDNPRWIYWGTQGWCNPETGECEDPLGIRGTDTDTAVINSSYGLTMRGTNFIPTITMLAHAKRGELNHSNNPTYLTKGQEDVRMSYSGEINYTEKDSLEIRNTVHSPYNDPPPAFKKQTWISKIGIYDENKNLIAIAKLAKPILKTEDREFTFKLKLDF